MQIIQVIIAGILAILTAIYEYFTYLLVRITTKAPFVSLSGFHFHDGRSNTLGGWKASVYNEGPGAVVNLEVRFTMKQMLCSIGEDGKITVLSLSVHPS